MTEHKTDAALKLAESEPSVGFPDYFMKAIGSSNEPSHNRRRRLT